MTKILANDGISQAGIDALTAKEFTIVTEYVAQNDLIKTINTQGYEVLLVRSATTVRKDLIDACPNLKIIGRGGVGMDNIDVDYARKKGIKVISTPASSSISVAELVFAHLFSMVRFLFDSNRQMPLTGDSEFKKLKKSYENGRELAGKTLGIIGFGRIGQEVAKKAIGLGMNVMAHDKFIEEVTITLDFFNGEKKSFTIETKSLNEVLSNSDFITLHVPKIGDEPVIGAEQIGMMKTGAGIVNTSRGGVIDETALMFALDKHKLAYAGLDVFDNEPNPSIHICMHNAISLTPHIGAATLEAQERIGTELADQIATHFGK
ncbi:MAG: D-2-hydroxyacid dehydrogenase [Pelagibacterales bacterium]|jgi:D-3-phosphoglycerate dehydrogenase / 2-oxoglutarate reductase|nr:D-2-hydroxyacid dehydrogenase [Pelagibacterales bacterium]MDA1009424.1 D-2-hydroxyacid dehydrogenase [Bacteroidota bacterium]